MLVPRLLDAINVPYLVKNTPKKISCEASEAEAAEAEPAVHHIFSSTHTNK